MPCARHTQYDSSQHVPGSRTAYHRPTTYMMRLYSPWTRFAHSLARYRPPPADEGIVLE
ncbi:hypothetical protein PISMIDRAFT_682892, partial [Pisolithus microcarpus 441]